MIDAAKAREGLINDAAIRAITVEAAVDTRASTIAITEAAKNWA